MAQHGDIPEWYEKDSLYYDTFNEDTENSRITNSTIEKILSEHKVKTVLDLTCGTGSQVFWLAKRGYQVTGSDISPGMLKIAQNRAREEHADVKLLQGDMRTLEVGEFDAAITMYNAVGHLTKAGFEKAMGNICRNLKAGGLYLFDIFNLSYVGRDDNISKLTIDWVSTTGDKKARKVQHSTIDDNGVLTSYTTSYVQKGATKPTVSQSVGTLQLYTAQELREMLTRNGFQVLAQQAIDGSPFLEKETERILIVAQRAKSAVAARINF